MVAKLEKGQETPIFKDISVGISDGGYDQGSSEDSDGSDDGQSLEEGESPKREVAYYKIMVKFSFRGDYLNYTYFRRDLAKQKKIINIEEEIIEVSGSGQDDNEASDGSVRINATLSTYRFPHSDAERFVVDDGSI